jgi:signal transduction histidine kinase/ActR/RegA family two-component response regulator
MVMLEELYEKEQVLSRKTYILRNDRKVVPVESSIVLLKDSYGEAFGGLAIIRDITDRIQAEEDNKIFQTRLNRAEKMEAVGTLAGGVAHDLNNILGAIIGYPELMLDDIPKDSPLKSSILAIKKSGERAVSVIEDLLTMTRMGVVVSEVENLNKIIADYLATPEFHKLKEFHPDISVETNLAADLLNILGSPVHLIKLVMNLVSNAAEAMPGGGKIIVSTENTYLDKVVKGYDRIEEGDYVLLTVSDEGIGISGKDLNRIFEPFYTKKVMGRSGTGLGMAVVWGTVKDHRGYIDIESKEGTGTTFRIYLPVTREEIEDRDKPVPIEEYVGNGEKILIIDDVKAQREIASNMLTKLNYKTETVKSGEEAVEYLKNNSADILILDMIMDPGIDGLETYKRILETHPNQKAVIASGFSETDRVREVQKLGASAYIKKPYTLEKIGLAVKAELKNTST